MFHITFLVLFGVFNIHIQVSRSDCGLEEAITVGNSNLTSHEHFGNAKRISEILVGKNNAGRRYPSWPYPSFCSFQSQHNLDTVECL